MTTIDATRSRIRAQPRSHRVAKWLAIGLGGLVVISVIRAQSYEAGVEAARREAAQPRSPATPAPTDPAPAKAEASESAQTKAPTAFEEMGIEETLAKENLKQILKDSDGAKFRNVNARLVELEGKKLYTFCGEMNAKNSFGAYGGYERFIAGAATAGSEETIADFDEAWATLCEGGRLAMSDLPF